MNKYIIRLGKGLASEYENIYTKASIICVFFNKANIFTEEEKDYFVECYKKYCVNSIDEKEIRRRLFR